MGKVCYINWNYNVYELIYNELNKFNKKYPTFEMNGLKILGEYERLTYGYGVKPIFTLPDWQCNIVCKDYLRKKNRNINRYFR